MINMKSICLFYTLLCFNTQLLACEELLKNNLTDEQVSVLYKSYMVGQKEDLGYSLAAIAWKESMAGKYQINLQDPSAGVFHISVKNALKHLDIKDTNFNRNRVAQMLINDFDLSAEYAIMNLKFWQKKYGTNWNKIWASYNAGYNVKAGSDYAKSIKMKIKTISKCNW